MFAKNFRAAATDWRLRSEPGSLRVKRDGELIFPDFVFVHHSGQQVFLELFHRWHRGQLLRRLQQIPQHPDWSLALGVDMAVAKDQEVQAELEKATWFQKRGFLFRDYPTMEKTLKCLNGFLQE